MNEMSERSKQIRRDTIALSKANGGYHYGGCFSIVEILIALFDYTMKPKDKFILSKGHSCWPYYVILRELGYNPKLFGHPTRDEKNGVYCTTGSEGHGFPVGVGMALAKKIKNEEGIIYVLMGDGECQEGTTWESLLIAGKHKLDNLVVVIDKNKIQGSDYVNNILPIDGIEKIFHFAGWVSYEGVNGHSIDELVTEFRSRVEGYPQLIIANTVKGKGVSFMENEPKWHACWLDIEKEQLALKELQ